MGLRWAKGHGTENDFVIVPDLAGVLDLKDAQVAALCDRRAGIGGDGLLRVVRERAAGLGEGADRWFMDYRNADGSIAEMCGNGIRVYVAYLVHAGLVALADGETIEIGTRAGVKTVRRVGAEGAADPQYAVAMGPWRLDGERVVRLDGAAHPGLCVDVGNPHVVIEVAGPAELAAADLTRPPAVEPPPPAGINVELVTAVGVEQGPDGVRLGRLTMRVHERGVGETRSCGTGAVAAALATRARLAERDRQGGREERPVDAWQVAVPGGLLRVAVPAGAADHADTVQLQGPAVIVAEGELV